MRVVGLMIMLVCTVSVYGQRSEYRSKGDASGESTIRITGTVIDGNTNKPLEYTTVSVLSKTDSVLITGVITNEEGKFEIAIKPGQYILRLQFISYNTQYIGGVSLNTEQRVANIGTVKLSPDTETLDEVVVTGQKSQVEMSLDKRVFNIGKDLSNAGNNAAEILDNIPSVTVDVEGNVSLRGSENVRILVDGKQSGLVGISSTDALRQLQGNLIERIEVVTNPSARYDAEGMAGIINIVLKKENRKGVNGAFTLNAGYPENFGSSFNLNYRKEWINLFANYGLNYRKTPGSGFADQKFTVADSSYYTFLDRSHERSGLSNSIRFGSDFYLNDKNTLTAAALYRISDEDNQTELEYNDFDVNRTLLGKSYRYDNEIEEDGNMEYSLSYQRAFDNENHKLTADIQYRDSGETEDSDQLQGPIENGIDQAPDLFQRSLNEENESNILLQADYVYPFGEKGKFEAGVKSTFRDITNNYIVEELDDNGVWVNLPSFTNDFTYEENIYAAYSIYGNKVNKFSYQVGLRIEITDISTLLKQTNESNSKNYTNLFPSAHINYELKKQNSLQASYSRRLNRPRFRNLNPFSSFADPRNIRTGNPDLDPEYTDSYELGYLRNWKSGSMFYGVYYRYTTGVVTRIRTAVDGVTFSLPVNLNSEDSYGVELTYSQDLTDWWSVNGSANFYRQTIQGSFSGEDLSSDTYTMSTRWSSKVTLWKSLDLQSSVMYRAPQQTPQGSRKSFYTIDLGASRDVLKGKGTITLSVRDLLNSRKWRSETFGDNFESENEFQWRARQVLVSFTYRLNQRKKRDRGDRDFDGDDMDF